MACETKRAILSLLSFLRGVVLGFAGRMGLGSFAMGTACTGAAGSGSVTVPFELQSLG